MPLTQEEAEFLVKEVIAEEGRRLITLLRPYHDVLSEIEARRPPRPMTGPDGRTFIYSGPTAEDIAGPWNAPRWLEAMCRDDSRFAALLHRFRERNT